MDEIFINNFIDLGIKTYLKEKSNKYYRHNVPANIIKQLVFIYGEEKIITPYQNKNTQEFVNNLMMFGYKKDNIIKFLRHMNDFLIKKDYALILIEKMIIDMYFCMAEKSGSSEEEQDSFECLLYTKTSSNLLLRLYNLLLNKSDNAITNYWKNKLFEFNNPIELQFQTIYLDRSLYEQYGFNMENIKSMNESEILMLNKKIKEDMTGNEEVSGGRTETNNETKKLVLVGE